MRITVNAKEVEAPDGVSVQGLLDSLGLSERRVAVELNRAIIAKEDYPAAMLKDGDTLEILSFVGGG